MEIDNTAEVMLMLPTYVVDPPNPIHAAVVERWRGEALGREG